MDPNDLDEFREVLVQTWAVAPSMEAHNQDSGYDEMLRAIRGRVEYLLKHDQNKLMSALYILDVSEAKYREAMALSNWEASVDRLARVILERELQRFETRKRYRNTYNLDGPDSE